MFWEELITYFSYISHLFEVLEPNLSELTLTSFDSV
jgi:hypothetical protein